MATLISPSGGRYVTDSAVEINDLIYGQGYRRLEQSEHEPAPADTDVDADPGPRTVSVKPSGDKTRSERA